MAQANNDGSGRAPVTIVRPTTTVTSGVGVTQKLVTAAVAFGDLMRGTFGPQGLDKMLYKTNGTTAVTNDGAKIVSELLVKHPAAKAFVHLAEAQEQACGDGVTGCMIFASELMREAGRLLDRGLHPLILTDGYQKAIQVARHSLESSSEQWDTSRDQLIHVAKTAMNGTAADIDGSFLAELVVDGLQTVSNKSESPNYEDIRMAKRTQGNLLDSRLVDGLIVDTSLILDRLPRKLEYGTLLALTCPLDHESSSRDSDIEVETADEWMAFVDAKDAILQKKVQQVLSTGATAVFSAETIEQSITHALTDAGCFVLGGLERAGIEDIAKASGASMCDHIDDLSSSSIGSFEQLLVETSEGLDGRRERLCLRFGESAGLCTIDVGGGDGVAAEEVIRGLYDALRSTSQVIKTRRLTRGGGCAHMAAALAVKEEAEQQSGRQRLAMEAFARSLEAIPSTLATNAGADQLDTLLALRSAHRNGEHLSGIAPSGLVEVVEAAWAPTDTILHGLEAATETACGLLRVDQVISARGD